ncbi:LysM domain-containing protein [Pontibacter ummariensis]|uniref:LysM domain-containing protein n=1 Tax=Pontibacter ummariensis TaxID=1610492 RepID=A0A239HEK8_9BACT|nr:LysM peptidoglycan-binding domain-containing protein [Pontibacter ummariensis]PRY10643.1 LysM domain-containing protein [Pontibacter ummariensis]SNS79233.1 LysM domain-containing protein [Pontibacter ummariensis]
MGLLDFFKKGKEEPQKPTTNVQSSDRLKTPEGTQPISKGTDMASRTEGDPSKAFYNKEDKQKQTSPGPHQDVYTVQSGDSLSGIASKHYGNANSWTRIYDANKDKIGGNPDLIRPGLRIVIPRD